MGIRLWVRCSGKVSLQKDLQGREPVGTGGRRLPGRGSSTGTDSCFGGGGGSRRRQRCWNSECGGVRTPGGIGVKGLDLGEASIGQQVSAKGAQTPRWRSRLGIRTWESQV